MQRYIVVLTASPVVGGPTESASYAAGSSRTGWDTWQVDPQRIGDGNISDEAKLKIVESRFVSKPDNGGLNIGDDHFPYADLLPQQGRNMALQSSCVTLREWSEKYGSAPVSPDVQPLRIEDSVEAPVQPELPEIVRHPVLPEDLDKAEFEPELSDVAVQVVYQGWAGTKYLGLFNSDEDAIAFGAVTRARREAVMFKDGLLLLDKENGAELQQLVSVDIKAERQKLIASMSERERMILGL